MHFLQIFLLKCLAARLCVAGTRWRSCCWCNDRWVTGSTCADRTAARQSVASVFLHPPVLWGQMYLETRCYEEEVFTPHGFLLVLARGGTCHGRTSLCLPSCSNSAMMSCRFLLTRRCHGCGRARLCSSGRSSRSSGGWEEFPQSCSPPPMETETREDFWCFSPLQETNKFVSLHGKEYCLM